jgi:hypothetical protein
MCCTQNTTIVVAEMSESQNTIALIVDWYKKIAIITLPISGLGYERRIDSDGQRFVNRNTCFQVKLL